MGKPESITAALFVTKDVLRQTARDAIADMTGQFSEADVFAKVREAAMGSNLVSLLDESAWSITKSEIRRQARPRLADNADWIGYGDLLIKLPEGKVVKVIHATIADLDVRENNVKENLATITRTSEAEIERIKTLKETMVAQNLPYAGAAIEFLERQK